jgi:dTDP-4-amino-4,6-dideoxygalactose transaminase
MKKRVGDFALFGGGREFMVDLHVGQLYFPEWNRYEAAMRGVIERRYYTNHGPVTRELEERLEAYLGVGNAVTVVNATVGLYMICLALGLKGKVMMPSFTFIATAQAAVLAGLDPVLCDVDRTTHQVTPETAEAALEEGVVALCPVNLWGGSCDIPSLSAWSAGHGLELYFDSAHGFGVERADGKLGRFGRAEVFSFHATKVMSATEGGCITTDDDDLAERLRNLRSNYGIRRPMDVPLTINARMSEGQSAIALLSLEDLDERIAHNVEILEAYRAGLAEVPGVRLVPPAAVTRSNHQSVVLQIDEERFGLSRDLLWDVLRAEGVRARRYFAPGIHRSPPFDEQYPGFVEALPVTDELCRTLLQLPVGALVTATDAEQIAGLVRNSHTHASGLRARA